MRIDWGKVPYYMITIKQAFGNLGKVMSEHFTSSNKKIYHLHSMVDATMYYDFYEHEIIKEGL